MTRKLLHQLFDFASMSPNIADRSIWIDAFGKDIVVSPHQAMSPTCLPDGLNSIKFVEISTSWFARSHSLPHGKVAQDIKAFCPIHYVYKKSWRASSENNGFFDKFYWT